MSTINKLSPIVRRSRGYRRDTVVSLQRLVPKLTGFNQLAAAATLGVLKDIQSNPSLTGADKSRAFTHVIKQLEQR